MATILPALLEPGLSRESQESLDETEDRVTDMERRIDRIETRSRSLGLWIAELQIRELRFERSRQTATQREAERRAVAVTLDDMNRNIIRLTTLVTILIEQHQPEDEPGRPAAGETEADR